MYSYLPTRIAAAYYYGVLKWWSAGAKALQAQQASGLIGGYPFSTKKGVTFRNEPWRRTGGRGLLQVSYGRSVPPINASRSGGSGTMTSAETWGYPALRKWNAACGP